MEQNRFIQRNKNKDAKKRYSTNFRSSGRELFSKKVSLKIFPPAYLHIIKIEIK